jgi:cell division transport system permease protein
VIAATLAQALREARDGLWRHPTLTALATLSIGVSLYVLGLFLLLAWNLRGTTEALGRDLRMHVYMKSGATGDEIRTLRQALGGDEAVAEAIFLPPEEARRRFAARFPRLADVPEGLGQEIFPASFDVVLRPAWRDASAVDRLARTYRTAPGVDDVRFDRGWFERLQSLLSLFHSGGYGLGSLLMLAVMITVGAVVRLTVLARREEIEIMKLVGATAAMIRAPFMMGAAAQGLMGGLVALAGLRITWALLTASGPYRETPMLALVVGRYPPASFLLLLPLAGFLLGLAAAALSLRRAATAAL